MVESANRGRIKGQFRTLTSFGRAGGASSVSEGCSAHSIPTQQTTVEVAQTGTNSYEDSPSELTQKIIPKVILLLACYFCVYLVAFIILLLLIFCYSRLVKCIDC